MPTFIDISALTKRTNLTGNEEFQVSATEKVTAQQIADLASSGLNVYTVSESEVQNQKIDASRVEELKKSVLLLFPNETNYTPYFKVLSDNSKAYFITGNIPINSQGEPGINNGEEPPFEQVNSVMIEVNLTTYDITILPYPIINKSWLKEAVQVTAFTESVLLALIPNYKTGDFIPFYTGNVTASADNQFPESGVFNGFISVGSNEGDYCQIFAFKTGSPKAYLGACIGSITQWTELGGNSGGRLMDVKILTTSFWNLISSNDTEIQAFVVNENSPEVPAEYMGEGFGFARYYRDDVGMATVTIKPNSGSVKTFNVTFYGDGSDANWEETGGSPSGGGLELVNTTYPILVGDGSEVVLPGVTSSDRLMINLQVIKTGSAVELWPTGSFCLHCPVPTGSGSYKLLDIYQFEKGTEADINISYVTKTDNSVTVQFNDYNNIDADFAASIHAIYKLPK